MVIISLVASIFSISSKYADLDSSGVYEEAQEMEFSIKKFPCINWLYVLRIIWRFNFLVARMFLLVCIWLVLGGVAFGIFLGVTTLIWIMCICRLAPTCYTGSCYYIWCVACVANPITTSIQVNCYHFYEMITWLTIITVVGFMDELPDAYDDDCTICANDTDRRAAGNPYTEGFIYIAWISFCLDFVLFCVLYKKEAILERQGDDDHLEILFQVFKDGQNYTPGVDNQPDETYDNDERENRQNDVELQVHTQIDSNTVETNNADIR